MKIVSAKTRAMAYPPTSRYAAEMRGQHRASDALCGQADLRVDGFPGWPGRIYRVVARPCTSPRGRRRVKEACEQVATHGNHRPIAEMPQSARTSATDLGRHCIGRTLEHFPTLRGHLTGTKEPGPRPSLNWSARAAHRLRWRKSGLPQTSIPIALRYLRGRGSRSPRSTSGQSAL